MKHFLINEWAKANRKRCGGGQTIISLTSLQPSYVTLPSRATMRLRTGSSTSVGGDIVEQTLAKLEHEFVSADKPKVV